MSFFKKEPNRYQEIIARTGFYTSLATYVLLLASDALRPGFVARYFSPHIFLLGAVIFGIWWMYKLEKYKDRKSFQMLGATLFALLFSVVTWTLGEGFEEYRILMVLIVFISPFSVLSLIRVTRSEEE